MQSYRHHHQQDPQFSLGTQNFKWSAECALYNGISMFPWNSAEFDKTTSD